MGRLITKQVALLAGIALFASAHTAAAQTPPAPALLEPAAGASLVQPITLAWSAVVDPDWPIGSYMWPVSSTSTFDIIIASGATNSTGDPIPSRETLQAFSNFLPAAPDRTNITTLCDIQQN